jgi:hypothetical protein
MFPIGQKIVLVKDNVSKDIKNSLEWRTGEVIGYGVVRDRAGTRSVYLVELEDGVFGDDERAYVSTVICEIHTVQAA